MTSHHHRLQMAQQPRLLEINLGAASEAAYTKSRRNGLCNNTTIAKHATTGINQAG
jgi:hypothetical protein